jgi:membrane protease YdiL (CAAX protease family)
VAAQDLSLPQIWKDRQYGAAIVAAPLFWAILLVIGYAPAGLSSPDKPLFDFRSALIYPALKVLLTSFAPAGWSFPLDEPDAYLRYGLIYPVLEEAVFRGLIQEHFHRMPWGKRPIWKASTANVVTSLIFAGGHLMFHSPLHAIWVFVPSLIFGHFRDRYGGIVPSICLHVFYNAGYMLFFP